MRNYPTVHCHPQSLDSGSTPAAFAERELELGTGVLTVTDHGSMGACFQVYELARAKKLTPVLGLEAYFRDDNCPIFAEAGIPKLHPTKKNSTKDADTTKPPDYSHYFKYGHLTMHFLDQRAYEKGIQVLSRAPVEFHGSEAKPLFNWADLEELGSENVIMTSGCLIGMVQRFLLDHNDPKMAQKYYERLRSMVKPGNFMVEVFPHDCSKNWVKGVFVTLAGGDGITKLRFHQDKWLRTDVGELRAHELVDQFAKQQAKRDSENRIDREAHEHAELLAVKNYSTWVEQEPLRIVNVEQIADFLPNECRPWCPNGDVQAGCNRFMTIMARKYGDIVVIGDDSHYAHPDEKIVQDVRLLQGGQDTWRFYGSYHRQSSAESFEHFQKTLGTDLKTFEGWVDNAYAWASRFKDFKLEYKPSLPTSFYPKETLQHTMALIKKHGRMDWNNPVYKERLQRELVLLHKNGVIDLLPYFFIDEEVCSLYESNGLLTGPGRGSAAGLLLTYLLGITHVDPLEFDLSLDRFITLDRIKSGKLPDIDQDLPHRDLLVDPEDPAKGWLAERFGAHVMQVSTDTMLKLRSTAKDVARMRYGRVPSEVEALTRKFAEAPQGITDKDFVFGYKAGDDWVEGSIHTDKALQEYIKGYAQDWEIVKKALGVTRQKGRHPCAFVIADKPISSFIPVQRISGVPVTQYTAGSVEAAGAIKMDFLVINSLRDLGNAIRLIQERSGVDIPENVILDGKRVPRIRIIPQEGKLLDVWRLYASPWAAPVFRDVSEGQTEGMFQFNTAGAVKWLKHFDYEKSPGVKAIDSLEAMSAFTALDRPGPLNAMVSNPDGDGEHNMLVEFARRARGAEGSEDVLPVFDTLFPETHGVMVYQEQLQKLYQTVTGCTGAAAEEFRSNIAKKKMEKVLKAYDGFIAAATEKMGSKENAQAVWDFIVSWGQYGFNKSHSICYSDIGFACGYLKHHFPLEWWTAVLRNAEKKEINEVFWAYAGHLIDLPDVKLSGPVFEIQNERIRAPLSLLQGVGEGAQAQLAKYAPYTDIEDFCRKMQQHRESRAVVTMEKKTKTVKEKRIGANGKPMRVDGKLVYDTREVEIEVEKKKLGSSAVNRKVVYTLIVAGSMDSLFPPNTPFVEQLALFEAALAKATGKKQEAVDDRYLKLNQFQRYQMRKSILPAYSANLLVPMLEREVENVVQDEKRIYYRHPKHDWTPFETPKRMEEINTMSPWPDGQAITIAAPVYIEGQRRFQYAGGTKEAVSFTFDWNGYHFETVKWPERNGKVSSHFRGDIKGAVAVALLTKYKEDRPFTLEDVVVVQQPLGLLDEAEESK